MDAMGTVGPELVTNGDFSNGTTGWGWHVSFPPQTLENVGGELHVVNDGVARALCGQSTAETMTSGKTYRIRLSVRLASGATPTISLNTAFYGVSLLTIQSAGFTTVKTYSYEVFYKASTTGSVNLSFDSNAAHDLYIDNVSIVEVTGNHATQTTTANKPVLRVTGGKYYGEFDGINDSLLTGNLALTNTFSIVVAGNLSSLPSQQTLIGEDTGGAQVYVTSGGAIVFAKVGTGVLATTAAGEVVAGTPFVATATLAGGNAIIRKNGVQKVSTASALTLSATTGARIGGTFAGAEYCAGSLSAVGVLQGASTNAELLTIEKWAASSTPGGPTI